MFTRDIVVHTNAYVQTRNPPNSAYQLSDDLSIDRIDSEIAEKIIELGDPTYFNLPPPVNQFAQYYAFIRQIEGPGIPYIWDEDFRLQTCISISRLIRPTTMSLRYAARVRYNSDSTVCDISPGDLRGAGVDTFLSEQAEPDCFTEEDAARLRGVIERFDQQKPPERVIRALWYHEYAVRTYYIEVRWTLVVTALESLVYVYDDSRGRRGPTARFATAITRLAEEVGVKGFGEEKARQSYEHRSSLAHGQGSNGLHTSELDLYRQLETILRLAILRAMEKG